MASMKWLVHSACHVVGYPTKEETLLGKGQTFRLQSGNKIFAASCEAASFQMPLHYPRYSKADYEAMEEWRLDALLAQYGLDGCANGGVEAKREYAKGAFLWPHQY